MPFSGNDPLGKLQLQLRVDINNVETVAASRASNTSIICPHDELARLISLIKSYAARPNIYFARVS